MSPLHTEATLWALAQPKAGCMGSEILVFGGKKRRVFIPLNVQHSPRPWEAAPRKCMVPKRDPVNPMDYYPILSY